MLEVDEETFDEIYAVNVKSLFLMAKAAVPAMRAKGGGSIINIGSGRPAFDGIVWYNGSKEPRTSFKSMAVERRLTTSG